MVVALHDYRSGNNQGIVAEHLVQSFDVFFVVMAAEILHKLQNFLASRHIDGIALLDNIGIDVVIHSHTGTSDFTIAAQADSQLTLQIAVVILDDGNDPDSDIADLIAIDHGIAMLVNNVLLADETQVLPQHGERMDCIACDIDITKL